MLGITSTKTAASKPAVTAAISSFRIRLIPASQFVVELEPTPIAPRPA
jgi:hypothetical protein